MSKIYKILVQVSINLKLKRILTNVHVCTGVSITFEVDVRAS